jgi:transcriptional regulator with GAF, ATPase, and Fis domain
MDADWLDLGGTGGAPRAAAAERHLQVLRSLLERDYLTRADWDFALRDLAQMVHSAVGAERAMVALWLPEEGAWTAVGNGGERLRDEEIRKLGSRSVLEEVRRTERPLLTAGDVRLELDSASIDAHRLQSVLAAPLYFWDASLDRPERRLGGCLYAHRTTGQPRFEERDVQLVLDIARLAQPTLNVLRTLADVRRELESSREEIDRLRQESAVRFRLGSYETRDPWFARDVIEPLNRVSRSNKVNILLLGPTGAGKTHLATAYHNECPRRRGPFVVLDCAQVTSVETLSAELFGYAQDSGYANAPRQGRRGKAELADGGTLFIDEIATLPAELQQKLLQIIERGTFSPLGSSEQRQVDLQVIAATNEDPLALVRSGRLREDLYWRICDVVLQLPPLSDRVADIPLLAERFLARALEQTGRTDIRGFDPSAMQALQAHSWSRAGNIRGLERTILRTVLLAPAKGVRQLRAAHLQLQEIAEPRQPSLPAQKPPAGAGAVPAGQAQRGSKRTPEVERICAAIREHGYASAAAKALGLSYRQLLWRLQKAGLSIRDALAEGD